MDKHPSEDELELYSMGRIPEPESIDIEEHLLVCVRCQDRLRETDDFVALMKETTKQMTKETTGDTARRESASLTRLGEHGAVFGLSSFRLSPGPTVTAMAAVIALVVGVALYRMVPPPIVPSGEVSVELVAVRSAGAPSVAATTAARLRLQMDTAGTQQGPLSVAVVSADGRPVWTGEAISQNDRATAVVDKTLRAGQYFVRISAGTTLLREFTFQVR